MKKLDSYLTHLIQQIDESALVYVFDQDTPDEEWFIQGQDEDTLIGPDFKAAKSAVLSLLRATKKRSETNSL